MNVSIPEQGDGMNELVEKIQAELEALFGVDSEGIDLSKVSHFLALFDDTKGTLQRYSLIGKFFFSEDERAVMEHDPRCSEFGERQRSFVGERTMLHIMAGDLFEDLVRWMKRDQEERWQGEGFSSLSSCCQGGIREFHRGWSEESKARLIRNLKLLRRPLPQHVREPSETELRIQALEEQVQRLSGLIHGKSTLSNDSGEGE